mmetsp:Transcript_44444/g.125683  ORF Transcript_44444/g.125683 Transcript_44444/m.125683 type:complete len:201 (+) Transcript_44444:607-1209(+)
MKTSLHSRVSDGFHSSCAMPLKSMWIPWNTNLHSFPSTASTPFMRKISTPLFFRMSPSQAFSLPSSTSPTRSIPMLVTDSSCWCSWPSFRNSLSISRTLSSENARMPRMPLITLSKEVATLSVVLTIGAKLLMARILSSTWDRYGASTRSILLSKMRSENASCSIASFSTPSGFSSSKCWMMCLASTTVTIPSRRILALM